MKHRKNENAFQAELIKEINRVMPDAIIEKSDPNYRQGTPDLTIYREERWAKLETKKEEDASKRANQETWNEIFNTMSFARFIFPENKEEVLNELYKFFGV